MESWEQYFHTLVNNDPTQLGNLAGWLDRLNINFKQLTGTNPTNIKCN